LDCDSVYPSVGGKGWGWEVRGGIELREGPVQIGFHGWLFGPDRAEGVEYCPVFGADIESDKMSGSIVPWTTSYRYGCRVFVGSAGRKMACSCLAMGGFPKTKHLIYLLFLEEGDGGVYPEGSEDAGEAVLYLHGALPAPVYAVLQGGRGNGLRPRAD
jgi:hypothetical protein